MPPRKRTPKTQTVVETQAPELEQVTELDTSRFVDPNADASKEDTPLAYLDTVDEADITHFEEDDDPLQYIGDPVDEDGDGVDDRLEAKD